MKGSMGSSGAGEDPAGRRAEWFRYYSEKRIGHQWFQVHLLQGLVCGLYFPFSMLPAGLQALGVVAIFVFILVVGLIYDLRKGGLEWD